ncbi:MAG: hypothetical protein ACLRXB_03945 [Escherichia coli]
MKSMNIAASSELVSRLSTHRRVVALAILILRTSRQSSLPLRIVAVAFLRCKRTGFHLPVFCIEHVVELPAGVTAVINGNEQQWLELESQPVSMKICCAVL